MAVLLSRLWPIANPEASNSLSKSSLSAFASWIAANWCFLWTYFSYFSPTYVLLSSRAGNGGDLTVLRHEPFYLISFGVMLAVVAYFKMVWRHRPTTYHVQDEPSLLHLAKERFATALPRLSNIFLYSFGFLVVERLIIGRLPVLVLAKLFPTLHSPVASRWPFIEFILDVRFFYHLVWAAASLLVLYIAIDIAVEYMFGRSFHLCESSAATRANPTVVLLDGLQSGRAAVRSQAVLELRSLLINEPMWRAALFRDFVGEEAASRLLCKHLVAMLEKYRSSIDLMNKDLKLLSQQITERFTGQTGFRGASLPADSSIFSPRRRNIIEKVVLGSESSANAGTDTSSATATATRPAVPDILEIKAQPRTSSLSRGSGSLTSQILYHNRYLDLVAFVFGRFIRSFPARVYGGLACEIIKSACLADEQLVIWIIDALGHLVVASYDEDTHGQVQFVMDEVLGVLIDLHISLEEFTFLPHLNNRRLLDDLFGPSASPTERRAHVISTASLAALETIFEKFADSLTQLKISGETRGKLRTVGLTL